MLDRCLLEWQIFREELALGDTVRSALAAAHQRISRVSRRARLRRRQAPVRRDFSGLKVALGVSAVLLAYGAYVIISWHSDDLPEVPQVVFGTIAGRATTANPVPAPSLPVAPIHGARTLPRDARADPEQTAAAPHAQSGEMTRAQLATKLQLARIDLQKDALAPARAALMPVLAAQPNNPDALQMQADLVAREQQRDAVLLVARGCEQQHQWTCAWHNAGNALMIDSTSVQAGRLLATAIRESGLADVGGSAPQADLTDDQ